MSFRWVPAVAAALLAAPAPVATQIPSRGVRIHAAAQSLAETETDAAALATLRAWVSQVTALVRDGELVRDSPVPDPLVPGRSHERLRQMHRGVPVVGADIARQLNGFGQTESMFGVYYPNIEVDPTPRLTSGDATRLLARAGGADPAVRSIDDAPALAVLPLDDGRFALAWSARVLSTADGTYRRVYLDATTGAPLLVYDDSWTQFAIGRGIGVLGDVRKVVSSPVAGQFLAVDTARPTGTSVGLPAGNSLTFDLRGDVQRWLGLTRPTTADLAVDTDNVWTDAGVVDAHAHAGQTYDYYYERFGRAGINGSNLPLWTFTNLVRPEDHVALFSRYPNYFLNAAYVGSGRVYYGVGLPAGVTSGGRTFLNFAGALDVVAHEITHAVTDYTSRLIYLNESGALNEAFSDIMGTAAEWMFQPAGAAPGRADWLVGEDIARPRAFRNMAAPIEYGMPDHYSIRFTGNTDNGGVHINSSIVNHVFYLVVSGGTHRLTGVQVPGLGLANRDRAERVFYRAFTAMLPSSASFATARAATVQAARDLYGSTSAEATAFTQAWTAVGVQ